MKKSDLKVGYVVKLRNGVFCMILPVINGLCVSGPECWFGFARVQDDLRCTPLCGVDSSDYDIMEVYGLSYFNDDASKFGTRSRKPLWVRKKPKKMTAKEICDALGYEVEIVKDGADE